MDLTKPFQQKTSKILFILFLVSLAFRLVLMLYDHNRNGTKTWVDALHYVEVGESFAAGDFFPSSEKHPYLKVAPGVPLIIAASKITTGDPILPVLILNCLLQALLVFVFFSLARELINPFYGCIFALWGVLNINLIRYSWQTLKESFLFFLIPLLVLYLVRLARDKKIIFNAVALSLVFAVLAHFDERYFFYLPFVLIFILLFTFKKYKLKPLGLWLLLLMLAMAPWTYRNYLQFRRLTVITPSIGSSMRKLASGDMLDGNARALPQRQPGSGMSGYNALAGEVGLADFPQWTGDFTDYLQSFLQFMRPSYFLQSSVYTLDGWTKRKWSLSHNLYGLAFYGLFLPFYILGMFQAIRKRNWIILCLGLLPLIHAAMHALLPFPLERYRLPLDFIVVLIGLWCISAIKFNLRRKDISHDGVNKQTQF